MSSVFVPGNRVPYDDTGDGVAWERVAQHAALERLGAEDVRGCAVHGVDGAAGNFAWDGRTYRLSLLPGYALLAVVYHGRGSEARASLHWTYPERLSSDEGTLLDQARALVARTALPERIRQALGE